MGKMPREKFIERWIESTSRKEEDNTMRTITEKEFHESYVIVECKCGWPSCIGWMAKPNPDRKGG